MPKVIHNGIILNISNLEIIHIYQYGMTEYTKTYPHNETVCIPKTMSKVSMHYCGMTSRIYCFMKRPRGKVLCIVCHFLKSVSMYMHFSRQRLHRCNSHWTFINIYILIF